MSRTRRIGLLLAGCLFLAPARAHPASYNPLSAPVAGSPLVLDLSVKDLKRQRDLPIRVYLPPSSQAAPVILFSHGLGGSREGSSYLGNHWAARGYVCIFLQHPGSDAAVWRDCAAGQRMQSLRDAASVQNFLLRVKDVSSALDQLEQWNKADGHVLSGRLDLGKVGMSGHSFGAVTAQAVSGQATGSGRRPFLDARIIAAVMMSPSRPVRGTPEEAFGKVSIPWLLMTGTDDTVPIGNANPASRLAVFPSLPPGGKYELVLFGARHSAFVENLLPGDSEPGNPNHHRAILALSTAFWDAYLLGSAPAKNWLDGNGPRSVLEQRDRWQRK